MPVLDKNSGIYIIGSPDLNVFDLKYSIGTKEVLKICSPADMGSAFQVLSKYSLPEMVHDKHFLEAEDLISQQNPGYAV